MKLFRSAMPGTVARPGRRRGRPSRRSRSGAMNVTALMIHLSYT